MFSIRLSKRVMDTVKIYSPMTYIYRWIPMVLKTHTDFNSHAHIDSLGEKVETWQDEHNLFLMTDLGGQPKFYSPPWNFTSIPIYEFTQKTSRRQ